MTAPRGRRAADAFEIGRPVVEQTLSTDTPTGCRTRITPRVTRGRRPAPESAARLITHASRESRC
ncbi:hypothetical protein [Streptomyces populi]|uniref:hypothetical protein n=1 Tax=Streptomyces populi TaxID=2058924 RepID=UPI0013A6A1C8|nr:hypothetical protein [Streptomyces populi]